MKNETITTGMRKIYFESSVTKCCQKFAAFVVRNKEEPL